MLRNLQSLYTIISMYKSSFNLIYKRAFAMVNNQRYDNVLWIYSILHN